MSRARDRPLPAVASEGDAPAIASPAIASPTVASPIVASPIVASPAVASPAVASPAITAVTRRLPSLTGLRFAAALGVFVYHCQARLPSVAVLRPLVAAGQTGVSFFFVLSGFVLTWSATARPAGAGVFWRRRAARILPSYLVSWVIGIPVALAAFGGWPSTGALLSTMTLTQAWFDDKSLFFGVNGVAWSLSCEVLFYALFPMLVRWVHHLRGASLRRAMVGCLAVSAAVQLVTGVIVGPGLADFDSTGFWVVSVLPVSRLPEFVAGMVAAGALARGELPILRLRWAVPAAAASAYLAGLFPTPVEAGWLTLLPFTALICAAASADLTGTAGWWSGPLLVRLGTWSFAFYLTHQLVIRLSAWLWSGPPLLQVTVDLVVSVAASAALYFAVEKPGERRWRPRRGALAEGEAAG